MIRFKKETYNPGKKLNEYPCSPGFTYISTCRSSLVYILRDQTAVNLLDSHFLPLAISDFGLLYLPCDVSLEIVK